MSDQMKSERKAAFDWSDRYVGEGVLRKRGRPETSTPTNPSETPQNDVGSSSDVFEANRAAVVCQNVYAYVRDVQLGGRRNVESSPGERDELSWVDWDEDRESQFMMQVMVEKSMPTKAAIKARSTHIIQYGVVGGEDVILSGERVLKMLKHQRKDSVVSDAVSQYREQLHLCWSETDIVGGVTTGEYSRDDRERRLASLMWGLRGEREAHRPSQLCKVDAPSPQASSSGDVRAKAGAVIDDLFALLSDDE